MTVGGNHRVSEKEKVTAKNLIQIMRDRGTEALSVWLLKSSGICAERENVSQVTKSSATAGAMNVFIQEGEWVA